MVVLGVFSSVTFWNELLLVTQAAIGPLLVLVGAFLVWLESDEWKMRREMDKKSDQGPQQPLTRARPQRTDPDEIISGTVEEVKEEVNSRSGLNYEALIEAEKNRKNRKTVIEFLERRL